VLLVGGSCRVEFLASSIIRLSRNKRFSKERIALHPLRQLRRAVTGRSRSDGCRGSQEGPDRNGDDQPRYHSRPIAAIVSIRSAMSFSTSATSAICGPTAS